MSGIFLAAAGGARNIAAIYTGTLGSGQYAGIVYGYNPASPFLMGTLSPSTFVFQGGPTVTITIIQDVVVSTLSSSITMTGFTSDPGNAALYSFQWKGGSEVIYTQGAAGYTYTAGSPNTARWQFSSGSTVFGLQAGYGTSGTLILKG